MASFSVAIMAHPSRERHIPGLLEKLPGAEVVWDERSSRWDTGRRSMLAFDPSKEWHVVVQDDAIPCFRFMDEVSFALRVAGSGPVAFYMGRTSLGGVPTMRLVNRARRRRFCWVRAEGPKWGPAVAVRTKEIPAMIEWGDENEELTEQYDLRMMHYFRSMGRRCAYSVPSLVQHRIGPDNPSLIEGRGATRGRQAAYYVARPAMLTRWNPRSIELSLR